LAIGPIPRGKDLDYHLIMYSRSEGLSICPPRVINVVGFITMQGPWAKLARWRATWAKLRRVTDRKWSPKNEDISGVAPIAAFEADKTH